MPSPTTYEIGTTSSTTALASLTTPVPDPESQFEEYSTLVKLQNGMTRGLGLPKATWHYGYLTDDQYAQLRTYQSAASAQVYISTMINSGAFVKYRATMTMPVKYVIRAGRYVDVTIEFSNLVAV